MLTLDIAIITYKPEGIRRVADLRLPKLRGVSYVISWQAHEDLPIPEELIRPDIKVVRFNDVGLSTNRNNSIANCTADVIQIMDDDVTLFPEAVQELVRAFEEHPEVDFVTFRSQRDGGICFPTSMTPLQNPLPKNYSVASFELAMRRETAGMLRCCPELGLGSPKMHGGEDEVLLLTAIKRGLNCCYFPITVCEHAHPSTGTKAHFTNENLRASGCVIALTFPWTAFLRVPLKAWRVSRAGQASFPRALFYIAQGAIEAPGLLRRNRKYLW